MYFEDGVSGNSNSNLFRQENGGIYVYVERLVSGNQANNPRYLRLQFNHAKAIEDGATWENGEAKINISEISFINENNSLIEFFGNNTNIFSVVPSSYIYPDALDSTYNHTKLMNGVTTSTSDYAHTSGPYNSTDPAAIVVDLGQNPPDITKIKIYNRVNTNEANIKQLQYVQLIASNDPNIMNKSSDINIPAIGWTAPSGNGVTISTEFVSSVFVTENGIQRLNASTSSEAFLINYNNGTAVPPPSSGGSSSNWEIIPAALSKDASELPNPGSREQYILTRTGSEPDGRSITIICKAVIPDGYTHFDGYVNAMAFLWTLRPNPDPKPQWGGGKYTIHEWGGTYTHPQTPPYSDKYRIISRKERLDGWGGSTVMQSNDMTVLPSDSNKEYTFIFRG